MIDSVSGAREKLKSLAGIQASHGSILSATLSTSRLDDWRLSAPAFLRSEFNRVTKESGFSKEEKRYLQTDLDYMLDVVRYDVAPQTEGVALFADGRAGLHERVELPFRLMNRFVIEPSPYVRPVAHALSLLEPFVLARVSRDESSLYLVDEWGVSHEDDLTGPRLRSTDRDTGETAVKEYYAAARQDNLIDQHFKEVGASLAKLLETSGTPRVALCAQHDIASGFRRTLPAAVAAKIVAEIAFDAAATTGQMVVNARQAIEAARHEEMVALAARIKEGLGHGGRGVSGFDDVLGAVGRYQVQTLLVDRNYRVPGWRCLDCGWVGLAAADICPACGGRTTKIDDAVGEIVRLAISQNGHVEVGENIPTLQELGGVAGVLRYS